MGLSESFSNFWKGYIDFKGRSSRSEFWWDILLFVIFAPRIISTTSIYIAPLTSSLLGDNFSILLFKFIHIIYDILIILPIFSVSCRRYHGAGFKGTWIPVAIIISIIIILASSFVTNSGITPPMWLALIDLLVLIANGAIGIMPKNYYQLKSKSND